ncbi:uncharacterized protein [Lepeophtheirus salmonis]|uniref:uncharacterized protein n=1 Tax=Lepeophtheirus salmonis TaxID=72036 RepID=UPI003AF3A2A7
MSRYSLFVISVLALSIPIFIPIFQFGFIYKLWKQYDVDVSKEHCSCSCWDTIFKAGYETGVAGYKHVYFNATQNTMIMWISMCLCFIIFYEALKFVLYCIYKGTARLKFVILFVSVIYPHYYAWWVYFNYVNDDYYDQFWHQLIFTTTEGISTLLVLSLICSKKSVISPQKILIIISIATFHILASGWDQFVENVLKQQGQLHQILRDIGFMIPDLLHVYLPWTELKKFARIHRKVPPSHLITNTDATFSLCGIAALWLLSLIIK